MYRFDSIFFFPLLPFLRTNQTVRPSLIDMDLDQDKSIFEIADHVNPWTVFLEMESPDSPGKSLPAFDKDQDVMLFFKVKIELIFGRTTISRKRYLF